MNFGIFHSIPEALLYTLIILLLVLNIVGLGISSNNAQQVKTLTAQNQKLATASQQQITCIASFFLLIPNRTSTTLTALGSDPDCAATIKAIQRK